jgi:hypothetical protein
MDIAEKLRLDWDVVKELGHKRIPSGWQGPLVVPAIRQWLNSKPTMNTGLRSGLIIDRAYQDIARLFRWLTGCRRVCSRFDKLDLVLIVLMCFVLVIEALR